MLRLKPGILTFAPSMLFVEMLRPPNPLTLLFTLFPDVETFSYELFNGWI
jgi:hypothetical protein